MKEHEWRFKREDVSYGYWECERCGLTMEFKHERDAQGQRTVLRTDAPRTVELNSVNKDCDEVLVRFVMRD